jgi:hypothetical protein
MGFAADDPRMIESFMTLCVCGNETIAHERSNCGYRAMQDRLRRH